jgi:hypothetical protein
MNGVVAGGASGEISRVEARALKLFLRHRRVIPTGFFGLGAQPVRSFIYAISDFIARFADAAYSAPKCAADASRRRFNIRSTFAGRQFYYARSSNRLFRRGRII